MRNRAPKKYLLVKPEPSGGLFSLDIALRTEPLELEYIAAMLTQAGDEYELFEAVFARKKFEQELEDVCPDCVVITGYITQEYDMIAYARRAKTWNENVRVIIGGSHAQLNPEHFFVKEVDFICRSDDIFAILELDRVSGEERKSINGLCYRVKGQEFVQNELRPFDINRLPVPDRSRTNGQQKYYRYLDVSPLAIIKTSTSCPYNCSFCYGNKLNCGEHSVRDLDLVMEEIAGIDSPNIQIVDDDFLYDTVRLRNFIARLREKNIQKKFVCYGRADFIAREPELMKELVEVGFSYFMVGIEAISGEQLDSYQKGTTTGINETAIQTVQNLGANLVGLFIIDIHFTRKDFREMRAYIRKMDLVYTGVSIFTPIPGTELYREYEKEILEYAGKYRKKAMEKEKLPDMRRWDFMHLVIPPVNMSRQMFYLEYYFLVMDLFRIASRKKVYQFLDFSKYKRIFGKLVLSDIFLRLHKPV